MTHATWQRLWILVLLANGYTPQEAHHIFDVLYGNQTMDLNKDPIADAIALVPKATAIKGGEDVRANFSSEGFDGLLQQSWAA
jgi:hypothetical protein